MTAMHKNTQLIPHSQCWCFGICQISGGATDVNALYDSVWPTFRHLQVVDITHITPLKAYLVWQALWKTLGKHATLPVLEVITPIASLSWAKNLHEEKNNYGTRSTMEKASWRAGKTAIMYDAVQISNHKIWVQLCFVWQAPTKMRLQQEDAT